MWNSLAGFVLGIGLGYAYRDIRDQIKSIKRDMIDLRRATKQAKQIIQERSKVVEALTPAEMVARKQEELLKELNPDEDF